MPKPAAIFISGRGSNMMQLVAAAKAPDFPLDFKLVVSNDPKALGLEWARAQGIDTLSVDHRDFGKDRQGHEAVITEALLNRGISFICLAGYMRVLSAEFVTQWQGRMINIHPSLLPAFKGLHSHERALEAGVSEHGCTVHWVSAGVDEGDIIAQARVPVLKGDTAEDLAARVLRAEHQLYPAAVRQIFSQ